MTSEFIPWKSYLQPVIDIVQTDTELVSEGLSDTTYEVIVISATRACWEAQISIEIAGEIVKNVVKVSGPFWEDCKERSPRLYLES
jgi:hypothetical protein